MSSRERIRRSSGEQLPLEALPLFATRAETFDGRTYRAELDYKRLTSTLQQVLYRLLDGEWHSLIELREIAPSADSRLRDLRKRRFGGFLIDARRAHELEGLPGQEGTWYYRLVAPERWKVDRIFRGEVGAR